MYNNIHRTPLTEVKHRASVKDFRCFCSMLETVLPHEALDAVLVGARIVCSQLQNAERHNEHHQKKHTRRQWFAKCGSLSESCHAGNTAPSLNRILVCSYSHTTQVSPQTALLIQVLAASSLVCHSLIVRLPLRHSQLLQSSSWKRPDALSTPSLRAGSAGLICTPLQDVSVFLGD